jgi:hypothetical protein
MTKDEAIEFGIYWIIGTAIDALIFRPETGIGNSMLMGFVTATATLLYRRWKEKRKKDE